MLTNLQLTEFVIKALNAKWVYWYGTYGRLCTKSLYDSKKKQYPSHYGSDRTSKYNKHISEGRWCADCIGLGKGFVWSNGQFETKPKYATNGCPDKSADGMFSYAKSNKLKYGKISTLPEIPGLAVRMSGHVGYYIGGGYVVEERGFNYGCVKTKLSDRKWTDWYEFPGVTYVEAKDSEPKTEPITGSIVKVTNGNYYVRTGPSTSYKRVGIIRKGGSCPYLGVTKNGWYNIEYEGQSCWIYGKCGSIVTIEKVVIYVTVKSGNWHVREEATAKSKSLGFVKAGDKLESNGKRESGWVGVKYNGKDAWITEKAF